MSSLRHRVLIADDDAALRQLVRMAVEDCPELEVVGEAVDGIDAVRQCDKLRPDVVVMDVDMPHMDGPRATERILQEHPSTRIIAFTGHVESEVVTRMIVAGAVGYAVKGADPQQLVSAVLGAASRKAHIDPAAMPGLFKSVLELARNEQQRRRDAERLHEELADSYRDTISALATALRSKDGYTQDHGDRVTDLAVSVGERLGLRGDDLTDVQYGAIFHDIGKIGVPDAILHNTDELTPDEWEVIKQHTVMGESIIKPIGFLQNVARIVRHSHENWDGTGYPDGLAGERIPLASRIVLACDAYDAMTTERTYQAAMRHEVAVARLRELSGKHFDPKVVETLVEVLEEEQQRPLERAAVLTPVKKPA